MSVTIFLSTVSDEFRAYRDQLRSDLTRHNVEVKVQEDFKDPGGDTLDKLDVYIAACDAVVHLVGEMTGSDPDEHALRALRSKYTDLADSLPPLGAALQSGAGVSYTQWEAWLALYHRKLLVIAKAADSAERGPSYSPTDASRAAQAAHLERLKGMGRYPGCTFTSPDNLAKSVLSSAVLDLLVENVIVQRSGSGADTDIQSGRPYLRLTQYVRRTKLAVRDSSETALLSAYRADVVPLVGRDREFGELRRWLEDPAPMSIRVLVGAGGRGKTRLALELARAMSADGWLAGFVSADELDRFRGQGGVEQWRWDKPALAIVDYAASRAEQMRAWLRELVDASFENRPKLRVLLLERQANRAIGWLGSIFGLGENDTSRAAIAMLDPPEPVGLSPLDELVFRREVFATLLRRSNGALEAPTLGADPEFDRLLDDRKWAGDPLYLMMAGLAAGEKGVRAALSLSRADLALSTARNELNRIGRIGAAHGIDKQHPHPGAFVRHMAVMATLVQGLTLAEARALARKEREALGSAASLDAVIAALADALPDSAANGGVAPILPDIVGEGAILVWLGPDGGIAASGLDPQARIAEAARVAVAKASSTLVRTAQDFAATGYAEPVRWLEALAGAPETELGALMEIADALPRQTLALRELAVTLTERIVDSLRGPAAAEANAGSGFELQSQYATALNNLGSGLSELGRREEALGAAREATDIYRRLAAERPDAFLPYLAGSLNNLGNRLSELGRREDALAAAREAVEIRRRLAAERPDAFLPDLAGSLNNLGNRLSELGRREDALAAAREAVDIRRRLAAERPDAFRPDLAMSLNNLGNRLSHLGRREDALAAAQEATDLYRRLAAERPDAFRPDLAGSLGNLGNRLSDLGRREDALAAAQEATDLYRRLAAERPDAFRPDLASSLNNLGNRLSDLGRREDALAAAEEATDIYRRLADERPDAFRPDLAMSRNNLGVRLSDLGRREDALAAAQEATDLYRRLAAERPDAFRPDLAGSLNNLGIRLGALGRREDALEATQEAVDIRRRLAAERPDAFRPDLAGSLNNLGAMLSDLGRREDALAAAQEATDLYRRLAAERPDAFRPDLAMSLNNLGNRLSDLGRREDALAAAQEATDLYRRLAAERPDAFRPDLAGSLGNLGNRLSDLGRREDALAAAQEATDLYRRLAAERPDAFRPDLARSLNNLGIRLGDLGRRDDALAAAQEAVVTLSPLFLRLPQAYAQWMSVIARQYLERCESGGVEPDAALLGPIAETFERLQGSQNLSKGT